MTAQSPTTARDITLVELLDRVVDHGVVLSGDITISVADVDLLYLGLRVLIRSPMIAETQQAESRRKASTESEDAHDFILRLRDSTGQH